MSKSSSTRQQINTELASRSANNRIKQVIENHTPGEELEELKVDFYCECSDPDCRVRLPLTVDEYKKLHNSQAKFVIAKGHASPLVEKVVKTRRNLQVVDKYAL